MQKLWRQFSGRPVQFIGVDEWEHSAPLQHVKAFVKTYHLTYPIVMDTGSVYLKKLGLAGIPTNVVIDRAGIIRVVGATDPDELSQTIKRALKDKS